MQYILGHLTPDTDSYCSAYAASWYYNTVHNDPSYSQPIFLGEPNNETIFVLNSVGYELPDITTSLPNGSAIILVDHNEASQSIPNRENYTITAVIDHHKVADFTTSSPLSMRLEPVACTCTILVEMMQEKNITPPKEIAKLMISAIISDTLFWRSPTTTQRDKDALNQLNTIANIIDLEAYSLEMFAAKSDLGDTNPVDLITMDYKTLEFHGQKMGIGVMETTNPSYALGRKDELLQAIDQVKQDQQLDQLLFCVVDILNKENTAFVGSAREEEIILGAFGVETVDSIAHLGERISRKKTIVPDIDEWFGKKTY